MKSFMKFNWEIILENSKVILIFIGTDWKIILIFIGAAVCSIPTLAVEFDSLFLNVLLFILPVLYLFAIMGFLVLKIYLESFKEWKEK